MTKPIKHIVIVGGGSAGWLTAAILAAEYQTNDYGLTITLIESPDIASVGVGEGTWPSMRSTLKKIGISETTFLSHCDASFKQGSKFVNWQKPNSQYYHPFTLPINYQEFNLAPHWLKFKEQVSFANAVSFQAQLCERGLAPKQISTAEYSFNANYGYHLDASKFAQLLQQHSTTKLGVVHILDQVQQVHNADNGDIASLSTKHNGIISGDLFIDCTGSAALLIGQHYQIKLREQSQSLANNSALALHLPYPEANSPIASQTTAIAQDNGWIWDIGLQSRRGVGYVYASAYCTDEQAEQTLRTYIEPSIGNQAAASAELRKLSFTPGYREKFWHKNCVAIGMSAGFIEPLEASALALIELSAKMVAEQLPANRTMMDIIAQRFNDKFSERWLQIIDFLKLHYVLSERTDSQYWRDHQQLEHCSKSLQQALALWRYQSPYHYDITQTESLFPSASFQYILYGMGFLSEPQHTPRNNQHISAQQLFKENQQRCQQLTSVLTDNRTLLNKIRQFGLPPI